MQWPLAYLPTKQINTPRTTGGPGYVNLTASGTQHTKGSYATLLTVGSPAGAWVSVQPNASTVNATDTATLLDLAVGGAGSETIIFPNMIIGFRSRDDRGIDFPLYLPAGATLRGRIQSITASKIVGMCVDVWGGEPSPGLSVPTKVTAYGVDTANSGGTQLTPNATAGTKGSYAELTSSTAAPIHGLLVLAQGSTSTQTSSAYSVDIAVGGSGSETIIVPDWLSRVDSNEAWHAYSPPFVPMSMEIPAGTRIAARAAADTNSTQALEVAVYGLTY